MRLEAKFTPTIEDFRCGYRMHHRQSNDSWKRYVCGAVSVVLVFSAVGFGLRQQLGFTLLGVFAGTVLFATPLLIEFASMRAISKWMKTGKLEELTYVFAEEGVEFSSRVAQSKLAWELFTNASLDERGLLIYTGPLQYQFIPARAFVAGDFPRNELKSLLWEKIKRA